MSAIKTNQPTMAPKPEPSNCIKRLFLALLILGSASNVQAAPVHMPNSFNTTADLAHLPPGGTLIRPHHAVSGPLPDSFTLSILDGPINNKSGSGFAVKPRGLTWVTHNRGGKGTVRESEEDLDNIAMTVAGIGELTEEEKLANWKLDAMKAKAYDNRWDAAWERDHPGSLEALHRSMKKQALKEARKKAKTQKKMMKAKEKENKMKGKHGSEPAQHQVQRRDIELDGNSGGSNNQNQKHLQKRWFSEWYKPQVGMFFPPYQMYKAFKFFDHNDG